MFQWWQQETQTPDMAGFSDIEGEAIPVAHPAQGPDLQYDGTGIGNDYTSPEHDGDWRGQDSSWNEAQSLPSPTYNPPF